MNASHQSHTGRARGGYTLLELLITVALLGTLGALAAPSFTAWIRSIRASSAADRLAADIAFARTQAVRTGRTVSVRMQGTDGYQVVLDSLANDTRTLSVVDLGNDYPGVAIATSPAGYTLRFDSRGVLKNAGTIGSEPTFVVSRGTAADTIKVSMIGRVIRGNEKN